MLHRQAINKQQARWLRRHSANTHGHGMKSSRRHAKGHGLRASNGTTHYDDVSNAV